MKTLPDSYKNHLKKSSYELYLETSKSNNLLVKAIRKYYEQKRKLSDMQRFCLIDDIVN